MLTAYKAGIGAVGTFWYLYMYWLLLETTVFSIFAKKEYDYYDFEEEGEKRAADPSSIDVSAIFNGSLLNCKLNRSITELTGNLIDFFKVEDD